MKLKKYLFALTILSTLLFVSCNPDSIAEDDNPYQTEEGLDKKVRKLPSNG